MRLDPGGGEERVDRRSLAGEVGVGRRGGAAHAAAGARGELPGRLGERPSTAAHLVERHRERVVQHERQPLRRGERLEHHEQRDAHRVGEHRLLFGIEGALDATVGKVRVSGPRVACVSTR